jgi:hypothetical protein
MIIARGIIMLLELRFMLLGGTAVMATLKLI